MELKDVISKRRAYRSLDPVEISNKQIEELAEAASLSASCFNKQPWRFVFVRNKQLLGEIFKALSKGNEWATKASAVIAVASQPDLDCIIAGREYFLFDTGMAAANLILRATDMGLVAHPIAGFKESMVKEMLNIPEEMTVITLVIIGRHSSKVSDTLSEQQKNWEVNRPERLKREEFFFIDSYTGV